jgi:hypothetical protein
MYHVYVPSDDAIWGKTIARGAGIVGSPAGDWFPAEEILERDRLTVDYEEPGHSANIITYADRVYHAYSRQLEHAPTHKRMWILTGELEHAGIFYPQYGRIEVADAAELNRIRAWLGFDVNDRAWSDKVAAELRCLGSGVVHA